MPLLLGLRGINNWQKLAEMQLRCGESGMKIFIASVGRFDEVGLGTSAEAALCDFMWKYYEGDVVWRVAGRGAGKIVVKYSYIWGEPEECWNTSNIYIEEHKIY